jgi:hypothetical protein
MVSMGSIFDIVLHHLLLSELFKLFAIFKLLRCKLELERSVILKKSFLIFFFLLDELIFVFDLFFFNLGVVIVIVHLNVLLDLSIDIIRWHAFVSLGLKLNVSSSFWITLDWCLGLDGGSRASLNKLMRLISLIPVLMQLRIDLIEKLLLIFMVLIGLLKRLDGLHDV